MHCEESKTYDSNVGCPVCGMDLVEEVSLKPSAAKYTCPMHPDVVKEAPGDCPICGMGLVPIEADESEEILKKNARNPEKPKQGLWRQDVRDRLRKID